MCVVKNEVQQVNTTTSHLIPAVQLLYLYTTYTGNGEQEEIQKVVCDANGGSFRLVFNGYTTAPIAYDANAATITAALNQLTVLSSTGNYLTPSPLLPPYDPSVYINPRPLNHYPPLVTTDPSSPPLLPLCAAFYSHPLLTTPCPLPFFSSLSLHRIGHGVLRQHHGGDGHDSFDGLFLPHHLSHRILSSEIPVEGALPGDQPGRQLASHDGHHQQPHGQPVHRHQ